MKLLTSFILLTFPFFGFATLSINPGVTKYESKTPTTLSIEEVHALSAKEFAKLSGTKTGLKEKISFILLKKELRKEIKKGNGQQSFATWVMAKANDGKTKMHWGTFFLVFLSGVIGVGFLGPLGVLLALGVVGLVHAKTKDKVKRKSAWWGLGVFAILLAIFAVVVTFATLAGGL
jgi:hypothetical protein